MFIKVGFHALLAAEVPRLFQSANVILTYMHTNDFARGLAVRIFMESMCFFTIIAMPDIVIADAASRDEKYFTAFYMSNIVLYFHHPGASMSMSHSGHVKYIPLKNLEV